MYEENNIDIPFLSNSQIFADRVSLFRSVKHRTLTTNPNSIHLVFLVHNRGKMSKLQGAHIGSVLNSES